MEIGQPQPNKVNKIIQKPNPNIIGGIEIIGSNETNLLKDKKNMYEEKLKLLKDEDLEDLPDLE